MIVITAVRAAFTGDRVEVKIRSVQSKWHLVFEKPFPFAKASGNGPKLFPYAEASGNGPKLSAKEPSAKEPSAEEPEPFVEEVAADALEVIPEEENTPKGALMPASLSVNGVRVDFDLDRLEVFVQTGEDWRKLISEPTERAFTHDAEVAAIETFMTVKERKAYRESQGMPA